MKTPCPNCGAEIEFRYDDSFVRICGHCQQRGGCAPIAASTRSARSPISTPIESPLRLFAEGHFGSATFLLVGMAQIRHEAGGIWQEWYAKFDGGRWGWLAEAQGRYYLTFEEPWTRAARAVAGLARARRSTSRSAASRTRARSARSPPRPTSPRPASCRSGSCRTGRSATRICRTAGGTFATIDLGGEGDPPSLYVGAQVPLADLRISGGEVAPPRGTKIASTRLACPNCNAPIELRAPEQTLRVVCPHCNSLVNTSGGALQLLGQLAQQAVAADPARQPRDASSRAE